MSEFLEDYEVFLSDKEESALLRCFDKDRDEMIQFDEFFEFVHD